MGQGNFVSLVLPLMMKLGHPENHDHQPRLDSCKLLRTISQNENIESFRRLKQFLPGKAERSMAPPANCHGLAPGCIHRFSLCPSQRNLCILLQPSCEPLAQGPCVKWGQFPLQQAVTGRSSLFFFASCFDYRTALLFQQV